MYKICLIALLILVMGSGVPVVRAEDDPDCLMIIEIHEVTAKADKGDSFFGFRNGDMELHLQLSLTEGGVWKATEDYPQEERFKKVKRNKSVKTEDFRLEVDMEDIARDRLEVHIIGFDLDSIEISGIGVDDAIKPIVKLALLATPKLVGDVAEIIADYGVDKRVDYATNDDVIGQDSFFINIEDGWETDGVETFTTSDEGLEIKYSITLKGNKCADS